MWQVSFHFLPSVVHSGAHNNNMAKKFNNAIVREILILLLSLSSVYIVKVFLQDKKKSEEAIIAWPTNMWKWERPLWCAIWEKNASHVCTSGGAFFLSLYMFIISPFLFHSFHSANYYICTIRYIFFLCVESEQTKKSKCMKIVHFHSLVCLV